MTDRGKARRVSLGSEVVQELAEWDDIPPLFTPVSDTVAELLCTELEENLRFDVRGTGNGLAWDACWSIDHPAVKADPYRPELIPTYNSLYYKWKKEQADAKRKVRR